MDEPGEYHSTLPLRQHLAALLLLCLTATGAEAEPKHVNLHINVDAGVVTAPDEVSETVGVGGGLGLSVDARVAPRLYGGLGLEASAHDYDELDGVPLGDGFYDPSWNRWALTGRLTWLLRDDRLQPYLTVRGGIQQQVLYYHVDQPGKDREEDRSSPLFGLASGGAGVSYFGPNNGLSGVRLEVIYGARPGHGESGYWSFTLGFIQRM